MRRRLEPTIRFGPLPTIVRSGRGPIIPSRRFDRSVARLICGWLRSDWRCRIHNSHARLAGCTRVRGRCHPHQFLSPDRLSRMLRKHVLPRRKSRWWRRRRGLRKNRTTCDCCRRGCHAATIPRVWTQYRLRRRSHSGSCHHGSVPELSRIHSHCVPVHRLRARECMLRHCGDRAMYVLVYVRDVVDPGVVVDDRRVVDVRDRCLVDSGVGNIDSVHVARAHAIGRNINLTRTKREPCNILAATGMTTNEYD